MGKRSDTVLRHKVPRQCLCDPKPGSISSSRCQITRITQLNELAHAKRCFADELCRSGSSDPRPPKPHAKGAGLVEPVGIEPTTSCLQSTRSPS